MVMDDDAVLVTSGLSQELQEGGYIFEINIYRLQEEAVWTLEVVDEDGTSHVWDDRFVSDFAALVEAQKAIRMEGPDAFMAGEGPPTLH